MAIFLAGLYFAQEVSASVVEGVRVWRAPDHTRLVFDLDSAVEHKLFTLHKPERIVIDIEHSRFSASIQNKDFDKTPITRLRHGKRNDRNLRIVLDLKAAVQPRSFVLKKHRDKPDRLVLDLYDKNKDILKKVKEIPQDTLKRRDIIIAISAGHGGEDPGAIGPRKTREKDIVFKISRELQALVNSTPGYKAQMLRTGDYYIGLRQRRNAARKARADLLVSVHADAFKNPKAKGASVFALSRRGATSETARFLASKENDADLIGGVGGVSLDDKDDVLASVLVDLSMTSTLANSLDIGARVLKNIGGVTRLHKNHMEQAGFAVLKSPDVPSILVETGFISNPEEERKLKSSSHRKKLAKAIFKGIKSYFYEKPPEGSFLAWKKNGGGQIHHIIARGDTLSGIAKRYNVTIAQIKQINRLDSSSIKIGQKLTIPTS